jgi:hypothetical protein
MQWYRISSSVYWGILLMTEIEVIVYRRPNMFAVEDSVLGRTGLAELRKLFLLKDYTSSGELTLYYPERFLNILEQRVLLERIKKAGFSKATITTHSVCIVQSASSVRVIQDREIKESDNPFELSNDSVGCY